MALDIAKICAEDNNAKVRAMAAPMLQDIKDFGAELILAELVADVEEDIANAAMQVLRNRQPWLDLDPFMVRIPPQHVVNSYLGNIWSNIKQGIKNSLDKIDPDNEKEILMRWNSLPGALPDVIDLLNERGQSDLAEWLGVTTGLYGQGIDNGEQLLIAPTYKCNITCSYCYSKEFDKTHGGDLSPEDLMTVFDWAKEQNIKELLLAGGEPTIYRHLKLLVETARELDIRVRLTSNGIYNAATQKLMQAPWITEITCHYDQEIMAEKPEVANCFRDNIRVAQQSGADVILRYTILENSDRDEWQKVIDMALSTDIHRINFGFSFLNTLGNNDQSYYRFTPGQVNEKFEKQFLSFVNDCESHGIELHQSKPLPLCTISWDSLKKVIGSGILRTSCPAHRREFTQNLTVNPDLTTFPCNAVGVAGPKLTDFSSLKSAGEYHSELITDLQFTPFGQSCESCLFFYRGICQGVCLAQHYASNDAPTSAQVNGTENDVQTVKFIDATL